jgi:hypothetical protein
VLSNTQVFWVLHYVPASSGVRGSERGQQADQVQGVAMRRRAVSSTIILVNHQWCVIAIINMGPVM